MQKPFIFVQFRVASYVKIIQYHTVTKHNEDPVGRRGSITIPVCERYAFVYCIS